MKEKDRVKRLIGSFILAGGAVFAAHLCTRPSEAETPTTPIPTIEATIEIKATPTARLSELLQKTPLPIYIDYSNGTRTPIYKR